MWYLSVNSTLEFTIFLIRNHQLGCDDYQWNQIASQAYYRTDGKLGGQECFVWPAPPHQQACGCSVWNSSHCSVWNERDQVAHLNPSRACEVTPPTPLWVRPLPYSRATQFGWAWPTPPVWGKPGTQDWHLRLKSGHRLGPMRKRRLFILRTWSKAHWAHPAENPPLGAANRGKFCQEKQSPTPILWASWHSVPEINYLRIFH